MCKNSPHSEAVCFLFQSAPSCCLLPPLLDFTCMCRSHRIHLAPLQPIGETRASIRLFARSAACTASKAHTNWRRSGRLVQISGPRGRKSLPTSASRTLDFPLLWLPTTATCGKSGVNSSLTYSRCTIAQSLQRPGGVQCQWLGEKTEHRREAGDSLSLGTIGTRVLGSASHL